MRKAVLTVFGGVLLFALSPAYAADMPVKGAPYAPAPSYYNWTGFYAGINAGYGFGTSNWSLGGVSTGDFDIDGFVVGGTLGYNQQIGRFVWGIEGDFDYSTIDGSSSSVVCLPGTCATANSWLATIRARLGWAFDRWMPFVTFGGAAGDIKATSILGSSTSTEFGWTFGGGLEAALWDNWTWKVEYLYIDLGDGSCTGACSPIGPINVDFKANLVRTGFNYRF
jgi:outer membrane immunogenic protein